MRLHVLLAVFAALLLYGCVEERTLSISGYETVEGVSGLDLTGDGINDVLSYQFRSIAIDQPMGISVAKYVSVAPYSYSFTEPSYLSPPDLAGAKAKIAEFDAARKAGESACLQRLGLSFAACNDYSSCMENCGSDHCEASKKVGGDAFGFELLAFKDKSQEMDRLVSELTSTQSLPSQDDRKEFIRKTVRLMAVSSDLAGMSMFNSNTYGTCGPVPLRLDLLGQAAQLVGTTGVSPDRYRYRVSEVITGGTEEEHITLFIQDTPPVAMSIDELSVDIPQGVVYQKFPLRLGWENIRADSPRKVLVYDFTSPDAPQDTVVSRWSNPQIDERNVKFFTVFSMLASNPAVSLFTGISKSVFTLAYSLGLGYFTALGAAAAFLLYVVLLAIMLITALYHALRAYMDRKDVREYLIDRMGPPITDWRSYVGVGAGLIIVCFLLNAFYIRPTEVGQLDLATVQLRAISDIPGAVSSILFILGAYTIYLFAEDRLKGIVLGEGYFRAKGATKEENVASLSKLKVLSDNLKTRIDTLSHTGMDVKEEYSVLIAVPTDRLEQFVEIGKQNTAKSLIDFHMGRLEEMDKRIEQKVGIMEENWPVWNSEIEKAVDQSGDVPVETLVSIPMQWREWAVSKFISEHRARHLILEDNRIKRRTVSVENMVSTALADLKREGLVDASIVIHDGKVLSNSFSRGNATVGAVLYLKLSGFAKAIARKFGEEDVKRFVIMGRKSAAVSLPSGKSNPLLFTERGRLKQLIEQWKVKTGEQG
ncbi:MAG: hypothetical protein PHY95_03685 [Candidatus ainarchaeum sp.]|nr:hypothetical protein [Candidatus ainarchaeum sp.]